MSGSFQNLLLRRLDAGVLARIKLQPIELPRDFTMESPGDQIRHVYFLEEGMASMTTIFLNGAQIQVDAFGREAMINVPAILGDGQSFNRIYIQIPGHGHRMPLDLARAEYRRFGLFQDAAIISLEAQTRSLIQSVGCNLKHSVEQRIARSLLTYRDKCGSSMLYISHDELAAIHGSVRPTISVILGLFRARRLIRSRRGAIEILDAHRLETSACECYRILRDHPAEIIHAA